VKLGVAMFTGFTEGARSTTGMQTVHSLVEDRFGDDIKLFDLRPWDADTDDLANLAKLRGVTHMIVVGYSYGGGYATPHLDKALLKRGIHVPVNILCDAVLRPLWLPASWVWSPLSFRSMMPALGAIRIPDEVGSVVGVRQSNNLPQGHKIHWRGRNFYTYWLENHNHGSIDGSHEWAMMVLNNIERTLNHLKS